MANKLDQSLENRIHEIVSKAALGIAAAVRQDFALEVQRILAGASGAPKAAKAPAAPKAKATVAAPVHAAVVEHAPAAKAAAVHAAPAKKPRAKRGHKGGPNAVTFEKIMGAIRSNPGLRSEQLQKVVGLARNQVKAALATLRETGRVKTAGERRGTTYTAA